MLFFFDLHLTGAQVKYDLSKKDGERVVDLKLRCLDCDIPKFEPVDLSANYSILVTSFLAGGGDGYKMLVNERLDYENLGKVINLHPNSLFFTLV